MHQRQRPGIEGLERRRLLALTASFDSPTKTLTITGSDAAEQVSVGVFEQLINVTKPDGSFTEFPYSQYPYQHVRLNAFGGNDNVHLDIYLPTRTVDIVTDLGSGNDTFDAIGGAVTVLGGSGNDTITGSSFRDSLNGGDGDDSLAGGMSIDSVNGAAGNDTARYDQLDSLISTENKIDLKGSAQVINGTLIVQGTEGADVMAIGGTGIPAFFVNGTEYWLEREYSGDPAVPPCTRIELRGLGGDDFLDAYEIYFDFPRPKIVLDGGSGNDNIRLSDIRVSVAGGSGDDVVHMSNEVYFDGLSDSAGVDTIEASSWFGITGGLDLRLYPGIENAIARVAITGNDLDNVLIVGNVGSPTTLSGGKGNDILVSSSAGGLIDGGEGNDFLIDEGDTPHTLNGGTGTDTLVGSAGSTLQNGEVNNPTIPPTALVIGSSGNITVSGTEGADTIQVLAWDAAYPRGAEGLVIVNKVPHYLNVAPKKAIAITARGNGGNDRIEMRASGAGVRGIFDGGDGNDTLLGGSYNDSLYGSNNDDTLDGRGGADSMQGGTGSDLVDYSSRTAGVTVGIGTLADDGEANEKDNVYNDVEKVRGGKGNDKLSGVSANNVLYGGAGNDSLIGNGGNDALFGESGNDSLDGGDGNDYLDGGSGNDILRGGASVDQFFGYDGDDTFYARDGNKETVNGGNGSDKAQKDALDVLVNVENVIA